MPEPRLHPDTAEEIRAAWAWYESQAAGLGDDFLADPDAAMQAIGAFPETWPRFRAGTRRYLLRRFPFSVIYHARGDRLLVLAVMHHRRQPDYWLSRTEPRP